MKPFCETYNLLLLLSPAASRWFGSLINGETLIQMMEAFQEAVINFTPNENRRKAMRLILEKEKEMDRLENEYRTKTVERIFQQASENLDKQWEDFGKQQAEMLRQEPDGLLASFGS